MPKCQWPQLGSSWKICNDTLEISREIPGPDSIGAQTLAVSRKVLIVRMNGPESALLAGKRGLQLHLPLPSAWCIGDPCGGHRTLGYPARRIEGPAHGPGGGGQAGGC